MTVPPSRMVPAVASLAGKTLFITGASRGIGKAIGLRAALDGANVVIAAKTVEPHPKLPGTIHTAAEEIERAGGHALAVPCDIRFEDQIQAAVAKAVARFGGIDILVNNASAIHLAGTAETPMKRYDLMFDVNVRGAFATTQACLSHLRKAANPHVLNLSPPPTLEVRWHAAHPAYTASKLVMSLWVLGMAEEFREAGIAFNALWPRSVIDTAALNLLGGESIRKCSRSPDIVADAAHAILSRNSRSFTGHFCIDEDVLREEGIRDFSRYRRPDVSEESLLPDLFL